MTAASSPASVPSGPDRVGSAGLVVLAVDDEAPALDEVSYLLRGDPRVSTDLTARDASEALKVLQPNSQNPVPEAVLLDIAMPGWDGVDLARVLSSLPRPPAVAFLSARDDRAIEAHEIGVVDYLLKPVRAARLAAAVTRERAARDGRPSGQPTARADAQAAVARGTAAGSVTEQEAELLTEQVTGPAASA